MNFRDGWLADVELIGPGPYRPGMIFALLLFAFGVAMFLAPRVFATRSEATRQRRLEEIEAGSPEQYFEEQRDLLAYKPSQRFLLLWRVTGAAIAVGTARALIDRSGITG